MALRFETFKVWHANKYIGEIRIRANTGYLTSTIYPLYADGAHVICRRVYTSRSGNKKGKEKIIKIPIKMYK